ncbi:MAG TPA: hypothetical protein VM869_23405 [Enhygromyxa sp.]|nr:hypothetical protein [Enhygromyxa sp.]
MPSLINRLDFGNGQTAATWLPLALWREHVLRDLTPEKGTGETAIDWMAQVELVEIPKHVRG